AEHENAHESKENDCDDREPAWHVAALQQPNQRREHEAQQDRQRDRDEHLPTEIERADDDRRNDGAPDPLHKPLSLPHWRANNWLAVARQRTPVRSSRHSWIAAGAGQWHHRALVEKPRSDPPQVDFCCALALTIHPAKGDAAKRYE